ncbi:MAG: hypothetical protein HZB71_09705 [Betaproteobacteria bacterium]|nr:hypothetical protein [Betaproteobacteria bacterium]
MPRFAPLALALAASLPLPAFAVSEADLQTLRAELAQLKSAYETRLKDLESRLARAEERPAPASNAATPARTLNPEIALVLSGVYTNLTQNPANYRITGFAPGGEIGPGNRGFNLSESELGLAANIDERFRGSLTFALAPDNTVSTEEAYLQTTAMPHGLSLKAGRFLSGIGYLNEHHAHTWDFVDAPLAYQAFLGGQFGDDGVQLKWLAPTEQFLELGLEMGRGRNFPGTNQDKNGLGSGALSLHTGSDLGRDQSWRGGVSWLASSPRGRTWEENNLAGAAVNNRFTGQSRLWLADFIWKWQPEGRRTSLKVQGEYLHRRESGSLTYDTAGAASSDVYRTVQSGGYLQGVYQFLPAWRIGLRQDWLDTGTISLGSNAANLAAPAFRPAKTSLMLDWNPSEFSRIRLQYAQDQSRQGLTDNQLFLQYQMSLGAHPAHAY